MFGEAFSKLLEVVPFTEAAPQTKKPTVYYTEAIRPIVAGERASIIMLEHYRLKDAQGRLTFTSKVLEVGEDGTSFETQNTHYVLREEPDVDTPFYFHV